MAVWIAWVVTSLRRAAWAPILVFALHILAILVLDIYSRYPDFDVPMHFVGGAAIAYFFGACYRSADKLELLGRPSEIVFPPLILGLTSLAAVMWEFAEFVAERQFGIRTQPGLADTLLDLLMGLLGGIAWIAWSHRRTS